MAKFSEAIKKTLIHEGGYVNDPDDAGGETNFGISKRSYPNVDIKNLTLAGAKDIYRRDYWERLRADEITHQQVADELFDTAVNMGVRTATKLIQMALDVHPDGVLGNITLSTLNKSDAEKTLLKFKLAKIARYTNLANKRPSNRKYLRGWINRTLGA